MTSSCCLLLLLAAISIGSTYCGLVGITDSVSLFEEHDTNEEIIASDSIEPKSSIHKHSSIDRDELAERHEDELGMIPENPMCADGKEFCEEVDGYPEEYISKVLSKKLSKFGGMFGGWSIGDQDLAINHKLGDPSEEESLCSTWVRDVKPRAIKGLKIDDKWLFVINQENYTQTFQVEECVLNDPQSYCNRLFFDSESKCVQKHARMKLIVLVNGEPKLEEFTLPTCCACVLVR